jgi:hypothetical protein
MIFPDYNTIQCTYRSSIFKQYNHTNPHLTLKCFALAKQIYQTNANLNFIHTLLSTFCFVNNAIKEMIYLNESSFHKTNCRFARDIDWLIDFDDVWCSCSIVLSYIIHSSTFIEIDLYVIYFPGVLTSGALIQLCRSSKPNFDRFACQPIISPAHKRNAQLLEPHWSNVSNRLIA